MPTFHHKKENDLVPGQCQGITLLRQDESRHIAYGLFPLLRHLAADDTLWTIVGATMNDLLLAPLRVVSKAFSRYDLVRFGLSEDEYLECAGK